MSASNILDELTWRGLINQSTDEAELRTHLSQPRTLYCGFDPSASSLHVGHFV
ncbi:MAG: tyrosine--tRNA ligase, partial [Casimicrobium sp.]